MQSCHAIEAGKHTRVVSITKALSQRTNFCRRAIAKPNPPITSKPNVPGSGATVIGVTPAGASDGQSPTRASLVSVPPVYWPFSTSKSTEVSGKSKSRTRFCPLPARGPGFRPNCHRQTGGRGRKSAEIGACHIVEQGIGERSLLRRRTDEDRIGNSKSNWENRERELNLDIEHRQIGSSSILKDEDATSSCREIDRNAISSDGSGIATRGVNNVWINLADWICPRRGNQRQQKNRACNRQAHSRPPKKNASHRRRRN